MQPAAAGARMMLMHARPHDGPHAAASTTLPYLGARLARDKNEPVSAWASPGREDKGHWPHDHVFHDFLYISPAIYPTQVLYGIGKN
jgi:hypothetical protein